MSAEATGYVYRFSPYKGAAFAVHLAVADSVNDQHGNEFFMAQGRLAAKARIGRPAANRALGQLLADGYLEEVTDGPELPRGIVRYRFVFVNGEVHFDTRRRARPVAQGDTKPGRRRVAPGDTDRSPGDTAGPSGPVAEGDTDPKRAKNPTGTPAEDGEGEGETQAELARRVVQHHWDRCTEENRPRPVLKREGRGNVFMALAKIVEALLDAGYGPHAIAAALWDTTGGHTLQGLAVYLTKHRPQVDVPRQTIEERVLAETTQEAAVAVRLWPDDEPAAIEHFAACFLREDDQAAALAEYRRRRAA